MNLIEQKEIINRLWMGGISGVVFSSILMKSFKINNLNELYGQNSKKVDIEFINSILNDLKINHFINEIEISNLPEKGAFITVSNHPFGGIDGLLLLKLLLAKRRDVKVLTNYLLNKVKPLKEFLIPVDPFYKSKNVKTNFTGLRLASEQLENHGVLSVFPAGEVSTIYKGTIQDKEWSASAIRFIKNAQVPVVPIYFHGFNSIGFHLLGLVNSSLRTAKLPSELFNKQNKPIQIKIGKPISVEEQKAFKDVSQYGRYIRTRTYSLGNALEVKWFFHFSLKSRKTPQNIVAETPWQNIEREVKSLSVEDVLFSSNNYTVFCVSAGKIPITLNEIGRLREISFRKVGEGTNKSIDLDEHDLYYQHLFIWDDHLKKIVGAYRVGKGAEIIKTYGKKGFYINSLFKIKKEFLPVLAKSIELGRSFVAEAYQKNPLSLFLLWKGILYLLIKNEEYRYLIGPVTISNNFSDLSKRVMIDFLKLHFYHDKFSSLITPRTPYKLKEKMYDNFLEYSEINGDIKRLNYLISEIEDHRMTLPVLLRKYLEQNAKLLGFNIDPKFNKSLDGLIILDLLEVPVNTIRGLSKDMERDKFMTRIYNKNLVEEYVNAPQL